MNSYSQVIDYLYNSLPYYQKQGLKAYKSNLDNTLALDKYFNYPHKNYKTIHVAGTNGKGSVSHFIASILKEAGCKVGLYTSPHLLDFRERIKINNEMISEQDVIDFVNQNINIIEEKKPSFFEITVAMAFEHFAKNKVDWAVIEVGLGGRLDSTNIIVPELSIITNISFDHSDLLGNTLEAIAKEKAGIIKKHIPVVIGEKQHEINNVFIEIAKKNESEIIFAEDNFEVILNNTYNITNKTTNNILKADAPLKGIYQQKNIRTTMASIEILRNKNISIEDHHIIKGLENVIRNTNLMGRWQKLQDNPKIICDTAHNEAGVKMIVSQLLTEKYENLHIIWGMVNDKDFEKIISILPTEAQYYVTKPNLERAYNEEELIKYFKKFNLKANSYKNINNAYSDALKKSKDNDLIFIGGSTFMVANMLFFQKNFKNNLAD